MDLTTAAAIAGILSVLVGLIQVHQNRKKNTGAAAHNTNELSSSVLKRVFDTKKLRVGCIPFPPLIRYTKSSGAEGIYRDILNYVGAANGLDIEFSHVRNDDAIEKLKSEKLDACSLSSKDAFKIAIC